MAADLVKLATVEDIIKFDRQEPRIRFSEWLQKLSQTFRVQVDHSVVHFRDNEASRHTSTIAQFDGVVSPNCLHGGMRYYRSEEEAMHVLCNLVERFRNEVILPGRSPPYFAVTNEEGYQRFKYALVIWDLL